MTDDLFTLGLKHLNYVEGCDSPSIITALGTIAPDLANLTIKFGYGEIYSRPGLSPRYRQLATIGALAALGNASPQLKFHILGALNVGCTAAEIIETLIHVVVYAGFPAGLNGIFTAKEVFLERQIQSINHCSKTSNSRDAGQRYQEGWSALNHIDGEAGLRVINSLKDIAPDLARFVIEFAFGDIYTRPELDLLTREIVTIASLASMGTAMQQLNVHIHGLLNVGGTQEQLIETIIHIAVYAGFPAAINAMLVAKEVIAEREINRSSMEKNHVI